MSTSEVAGRVMMRLPSAKARSDVDTLIVEPDVADAGACSEMVAAALAGPELTGTDPQDGSDTGPPGELGDTADVDPVGRTVGDAGRVGAGSDLATDGDPAPDGVAEDAAEGRPVPAPPEAQPAVNASVAATAGRSRLRRAALNTVMSSP